MTPAKPFSQPFPNCKNRVATDGVRRSASPFRNTERFKTHAVRLRGFGRLDSKFGLHRAGLGLWGNSLAILKSRLSQHRPNSGRKEGE
jgi:hypothetical protein